MNTNDIASRLQRSIILYSVVGMLIIGTVVAFVGITPLYSRLKVEQNHNLNFTIHTRFMAINQFLTRSIDIAEQVTSRTKIRLKLEAFNRGEIARYDVVDFSSKLLEDAMHKSKDLVSITRLDKQDRFVLSVGAALKVKNWVVPTHGSKKTQIHGPVMIENKQNLIVGAPILSREGVRVGTDIVVFALDSLEKIVVDYTGLGRSGESILVAANEGELTPFFPLRSSLEKSVYAINVNSPLGIAAFRALKRNAGILLPEDSHSYLDHAVYAYRPMSSISWALIVKMDADELYGQINSQIYFVAGIITVLIVVATAGLLLLLSPLTGKTVIHVDELQKEINRKTKDLIANQERLERVNKELDQFAYVTSHDLKAPLRAITNLSEWIEEDLSDKLEGETKYQMELLRKRVFRMQDLIEGILQYARVGREKISIEAVNTSEVIDEVIALLDMPPGFNVYKADSMPIIQTSRVRFTQVVSNLLGNAVKYCEKENGRVDIKVKDIGNSYEFTVTDNGPGISSQFHHKIFVIFQTLHPRDVIESTGIGLTIVKKIVEEEGGKIYIESEEGNGATFRFTWPKSTGHNNIEAA